ncbi:MAG: M67 family metallopeptidase [Chloroflexi bacterium]|nr:M67 family metallopeptidase [Chloroflexota bacterium]
MTVELPKRFVDEMVAHALEEDPHECCGILAGDQGRAAKLYRMTNAEHSPYRYSMDRNELFHTYKEIDDRGWDVLAIYHSHTHSPAYPSATDVRLATWQESYYILVSLMDHAAPVVRAFRIVEGAITEEELRTVPG